VSQGRTDEREQKAVVCDFGTGRSGSADQNVGIDGPS